VAAGEWQATGAGVRLAPNGVDLLADRGDWTGAKTAGNNKIYALNPGSANSVAVRTRRDADSLYFGISVKDASKPADNVTNPERVLIAVATRDKAGNPAKNATAVLVETARGAKDTQGNAIPDKVTVYQSKTALVGGVVPAGANGWQVVPTPASFEAKASPPGAGADGYDVEAKLKLSDLGYPAGAALPNVQVLVVVFNSLDVNMDQVDGAPADPLNPFTPAYTYSQMPPAMGFAHPEYAPDVLTFLDQADYRDTNKWEPGLVSGVGDELYLGHDPYFWAAYNSIHVGYCDSTKFADVTPGDVGLGDKSTAYVYPVPVQPGKTPNPCGMRIFVRVFRHVAAPAGTPAKEVRALALWGVHGAGIPSTQWKYAGLSAAASVPAASTSFDLPFITFDPVPTNLTVGQHPCILIVLLPAQEREGLTFVDLAKIGGMGGPPDPIQKIKDVYAPADEQFAQYNIGT
ncbi:MAG: hypothetical protein K2V38_19725, partial [Gemmataceae bacterium]|nr:hypothetical protein [Gemmataceae bacterium]